MSSSSSSSSSPTTATTMQGDPAASRIANSDNGTSDLHRKVKGGAQDPLTLALPTASPSTLCEGWTSLPTPHFETKSGSSPLSPPQSSSSNSQGGVDDGGDSTPRII
jgi:hypothetical protein